MTQPSVPHQPERSAEPDASAAGPPAPSAPPLAEPARRPGASEATRLLCAGAYLDDAYRDAVIDELYIHDERAAAPSLGFDAARVLAHALAARRFELTWAAVIAALWIVAIPATSGLVLLYLLPSLLLTAAAKLRGTGPQPVQRTAVALVVRWYGRLVLFQAVLVLLGIGFDSYGWGMLGLTDPFLAYVMATGPGAIAQAWVALAVLVLLAWIVGMQREQFTRVLSQDLSRARFADIPADPAESAEGERSRRLRDRIRLEQHAPVVMYRTENPFCGAGQGYAPWSLSVELRPRKGVTPQPVDNSTILKKILPLLSELRRPSPHGSPERAAAVRDRLRELETDEVVFLPMDGLPSREHAPYGDAEFARHRDAAIEEGGETRRHFLRIRVGGWGEEIVTTVFVRVHTQGGMLMLEVAPHVLRPVKPLFRNVDRIAHDYRRTSRQGLVLWSLLNAPRSAGDAALTLVRGVAQAVRMIARMQRVLLPDGPKRSVRELGSDPDASLFQEMDISRYLNSVQDRVATGVRQALQEAGWHTDEFEQQIVNVAQGGIFIGSAKGSAFAVGDNNIVTNLKKKAKTAGGGRDQA